MVRQNQDLAYRIASIKNTNMYAIQVFRIICKTYIFTCDIKFFFTITVVYIHTKTQFERGLFYKKLMCSELVWQSCRNKLLFFFTKFFELIMHFPFSCAILDFSRKG